jgi:threonine dehydrogenase-like Zn-dependent dehydrogenase
MADGGLQEFVNIPETVCVLLPAEVSLEGGAIAEPLSVAVRALRRGRLRVGDRVAVVGGGAVGLLALQASNAMGARSTVLLEPIESRQAVAKELGFTVINSGNNDVEADLVIECSGSDSGAEAALQMVGRGGRIVFVGLSSAQLPASSLSLAKSELELIGCLSHLRDFDFKEALMLLASGDIRFDVLVHKVSLADSIEKGLMSLIHQPEKYIKILVGS